MFVCLDWWYTNYLVVNQDLEPRWGHWVQWLKKSGLWLHNRCSRCTWAINLNYLELLPICEYVDHQHCWWQRSCRCWLTQLSLFRWNCWKSCSQSPSCLLLPRIISEFILDAVFGWYFSIPLRATGEETYLSHTESSLECSKDIIHEYTPVILNAK